MGGAGWLCGQGGHNRIHMCGVQWRGVKPVVWACAVRGPPCTWHTHPPSHPPTRPHLHSHSRARAGSPPAPRSSSAPAPPPRLAASAPPPAHGSTATQAPSSSSWWWGQRCLGREGWGRGCGAARRRARLVRAWGGRPWTPWMAGRRGRRWTACSPRSRPGQVCAHACMCARVRACVCAFVLAYLLASLSPWAGVHMHPCVRACNRVWPLRGGACGRSAVGGCGCVV